MHDDFPGSVLSAVESIQSRVAAHPSIGIAARSYRARVLGISTVNNLAEGVSGKRLDYAEVVEVGRSIHRRTTSLLSGMLDRVLR